MKQYVIIGNVYPAKEELKQIKHPKLSNYWRYQDKAWKLIVQDKYITKGFEKKLESFVIAHDLELYCREWNGSKQMDNSIAPDTLLHKVILDGMPHPAIKSKPP